MSLKNIALMAVSLAVLGAYAISYPPYEYYGYEADDTDNPPVNYMKVVEPGRSGEAKATYVVLGTEYPCYKVKPGIAQSFSGDLVIPAYIDGLPVRKIKAGAFLAGNLRSVRIPSTVREIGDRAFSMCMNLKSVTFEPGVTMIGNNVFSNCTALTSVRLPDTLSSIGDRCFQGCISLTDVYFDGNAPRLLVSSAGDKSVLGERIYMSTGILGRFKIHINRNTSGWIAPYLKGVPEKWPVDYGYQRAHETVAEDGPTPSGTGFVTIVAEVKGGAFSVPESWPNAYPGYTSRFGSNFTASLSKTTGKLDASGSPMYVWQDYVAGTDPTDPDDVFKATIRMEGSTPVVEYTPVLSSTEKAKRKYTLLGKSRLADAEWSVVASGHESDYNFFRLTVEMK